MKTICALLFVGLASFSLVGTEQDLLDEKEAEAIGIEAYIYGYPLVTMEITRRITTNVSEPDGFQAPMGQFANLRNYPSADFKSVTAPNADTLYSSAWLDVSEEPYILSLPNEDGRYYLMPMLSAWTDVFQVPGKRTTGTKPQTYAITGPNWVGELPEGITEYKSPTSVVWIIGRTYCTGTPEDYKAVHSLQDKYSLIPLSSYGKPYTPKKGKINPDIDMKTPTRDQVNRMDAGTYFKMMAALMKNNPPSKSDSFIVEKMAKIGLNPGKDFDIAKTHPSLRKGLEKAPKAALEKIQSQFDEAGTLVNGWEIFTNTGIYGTDYLNRAIITMLGLGANRPQDAVYPTSKVDAEGNPYNGDNKYVIHFNKGQLPPVNGFWSLTMYNSEFFFVENSLNRYSLSQRNEFKFNVDGSVDLYLQNESPGKDKESNWLPAPKGQFVLMMRLYWPKEHNPTILNGSWQPPAVKKISNDF